MEALITAEAESQETCEFIDWYFIPAFVEDDTVNISVIYEEDYSTLFVSEMWLLLKSALLSCFSLM